MPHIVIKMLEGRTPAQKRKAAEAVKNALRDSLGTPERYISVSAEDYTPEEWQAVFKAEITEKPDSLLIKPQYKPEELL